MTQPRRGLGRGLDALISSGPGAPFAGPDPAGAPAPASRGPIELDIDLVAPNPEQPRTHFEPGQLRELADSIREHGIIQPLIVSRDEAGGQALIALTVDSAIPAGVLAEISDAVGATSARAVDIEQ